jgi:hypothetical protein
LEVFHHEGTGHQSKQIAAQCSHAKRHEEECTHKNAILIPTLL